jgi:peptidoglycan biosynthesis protein MviN/MurJ (putative lipid II flippase)
VALANFVMLYALMRRETTALATRDLAVTLGKLIIASSVLAAVCWAAQKWVLGAGASGAFF